MPDMCLTGRLLRVCDPRSFPAGSRVHVTLRTQNLGFLPHLSSANNLANPVKRVKYLLQELQLGPALPVLRSRSRSGC
jgi:hypothetical protein